MKSKPDTGVFNKPAERKAPVSERPIKNMKPGRFIASSWVLVLFLSLYGSSSVYRWVSGHKSLSTIAWAMKSAEKLDRFNHWLGLDEVKTSLDNFVEPILDGPSIFKKELASVEVLVEDNPADEKDVRVETDEKEVGLPHKVAPGKSRILIVGASSIQGVLGTELVRNFGTYRDVKVERFGKLATGLVRPEVLNWPKKLDELATAFKPDLILTNFGGNDAQNIPLEGWKRAVFGTSDWDLEYAKRVRAIVEIGNKHNALTINIGMPIMRGKKFSKRIKRLNKVMREATEEAGGIFMSTWEMAATIYGGYRKSLKFRGERGLMRAGDGIHYSRLGARYVADQITQNLERRFHFQPLGTKLASISRHSVTSEKLGEERSYLAFVPPAATTDNKLPVIYLLHDEGGSWDSWSRRSHRQLQQAAVAHNVVFVSPDLGSELALLDHPGAQGFFVEELPADVQRYLPVSSQSTLLGHGKGGFIALALALRFPDVFTRASALAAQPLGGYASLEDLVQFIDEDRGKPRLFLSVGVEDLVRGQHDVVIERLKLKGIPTELLEHKRKLAKRFSEEELAHQLQWHVAPLRDGTPPTTGTHETTPGGP